MASPGLFITGTDTGVGKTAIAAAIARVLQGRGCRVGVLKPVATGAVRQGDSWLCPDADALIAATGVQAPLARVTPLLFEAPLAPPVAARQAGGILTWERVREAVLAARDWWEEQGAEILVVEGVGGFLCPLAEEATVADLAILLDLPLVVVARRGLGTLNHTLLTIEAARRRGLRIAGVILNGCEPTHDPLAEATNPLELSRRLAGVPILGQVMHRVAFEHHRDPDDLSADIHHVDWKETAQRPRPDPESAPMADGLPARS